MTFSRFQCNMCDCNNLMNDWYFINVYLIGLFFYLLKLMKLFYSIREFKKKILVHNFTRLLMV